MKIQLATSNGRPDDVRSGAAVSLPLGATKATATLGERTVDWTIRTQESSDVERAVAQLLATPATPPATVAVQQGAPLELPTGALLTIAPDKTFAFLAPPTQELAVEARVTLPIDSAPSVQISARPTLRPGEVISWTVDPALHPAVALDASLNAARSRRGKHVLVTASGLGVSALAGFAGALAWGAADEAFARSLDANSREELDADYAKYQAAWVGTIAALSTSGLALGFTGVWEFHLGADGKKEIRSLQADLAKALEAPVSPDDLIAGAQTAGSAPAR